MIKVFKHFDIGIVRICEAVARLIIRYAETMSTTTATHSIIHHVHTFQMLLQIPFAPEFLLAHFANDFLFDAAFVVHVTQHNAARRIPLATFLTREILSVASLKFRIVRIVGVLRQEYEFTPFICK